MRNLLIGFLRRLLDADQQHQFRRLAICELDPQRFEQIRGGVYQLSGSPLCEDVEITINEVRLPAPVEPATRRELTGVRQPV